MRLPHIHMSNGAWIFASAVAMAIIAPAVYATSNAITAIGNTSGTTTAYVTPNRQLQTTMIAASNVVHAGASLTSSCHAVYTPPPGKAIVVTQVTYDIGTGTPGDEYYAALADANCFTSYDIADTLQGYETETRTYPSGLPMPNISERASANGATFVWVTGYLIPATQLPSEPPQVRGPIKGVPRSE